MTPEQEQQILLQARNYIKARDWHNARQALWRISNNPKAKEWLAKIDQLDPPLSRQTPKRPLASIPTSEIDILNRASEHMRNGNKQAALALLDLIPQHPAAQQLIATIRVEPEKRAPRRSGCVGTFLLFSFAIVAVVLSAGSGYSGDWKVQSVNPIISLGATENNETRLVWDCEDKVTSIAVLLDADRPDELIAVEQVGVAFDGGSFSFREAQRGVTDSIIYLNGAYLSAMSRAKKMTVRWIGYSGNVIQYSFNLTALRTNWATLAKAGCQLP